MHVKIAVHHICYVPPKVQPLWDPACYASTAHTAGSLHKDMQDRPVVTLLRCPPEMPRMSSLPTMVSAQISKSCKAVGQPPPAHHALEGAGAVKLKLRTFRGCRQMAGSGSRAVEAQGKRQSA